MTMISFYIEKSCHRDFITESVLTKLGYKPHDDLSDYKWYQFFKLDLVNKEFYYAHTNDVVVTSHTKLAITLDQLPMVETILMVTPDLTSFEIESLLGGM